MTASDLLAFARSKNHDELEQAWNEALQDPQDPRPYGEAIKALCKSDSSGLALDLGTRMVDALVDKGRREDAIQVGLAITALGIHGESFARRLGEMMREEYASAPWFDLAVSESGIDGIEAPSAKALQTFDKVRRYDAGNVLYHRSGWGEGVVEEFRPDAKEIVVRFAGGRTQDFPLSTALETFQPLDADDLRSQRLLKLEELQEQAASEPAVLIRMVAKMFRGKVTSTELKNEITPTIIPTSKWASWWKKAKAAAAHDPWLQIEGSKARPAFMLRAKPVSLAQEAQRSIEQTLSLDEAMGVVRDFLSRKLDAEAEAVVLEVGLERTNEAIRVKESGDEGGKVESHASILDAILLMEQNGRSCAISAAEELKRLLTDDAGRFRPEGLDELKTAEARAHAVEKLPEALGETWADQCIERILDVPGDDVEGVVDMLIQAKRADELAQYWSRVAPYPRRHPVLTYLFGRLYADGVFDGAEDKPDDVTVGRVMITLARILAADGKGQMQNRLKSRISNLLVGRRKLLDRCLDGISRSDLAAYLAIAERGGDDFPQEVTGAILRCVARNFPDLTSRPERPWWLRDDAIYTTKAGLARCREEHRVLVDVKIPENAAAIEHAASYGDLSENSEWEAAMEEQRNLTGRAQDMSRELEIAKLIEDQERPEQTVVPGVKVHLVDIENGDTRDITILGPWDCTSPEIINYKAPLAGAMLGLKIGDEVDVPMPTGQRTMRIDKIEPAI